MNFPVNANTILKEEITKVDNRLQPCRGNSRYGFHNLQRLLYEIVDKMGEASAKAQNLPGSITTGKRLETANQRLYIMKDISAGDQAIVIGILKVGTKKLFVYDSCKAQHELDPLCVLDFYVHESRQREGCGRKLFDFMLRSEGIRVEQLAIDRPSPKLLAFLKKHFNLYSIIPQVNNFVIFDRFFDGRYDANKGRNHGANNRRANNSSWNPFRPPSGKRSVTPMEQQQGRAGWEKDNNVSSRLGNYSAASPNHMGAGDAMYSRYRTTSTNRQATPPAATPPNGFYQGNTHNSKNSPSPAVNSNFYFNGNRNRSASPHMYHAMGTNPALLRNPAETLSGSYYPQQKTTHGMYANAEPPAVLLGPASTPNFGARSGRETDPALMASRHSGLRNQGEQNDDPRHHNHVILPDIHNGDLKASSNPATSSQNRRPDLAQRPPSGKKPSCVVLSKDNNMSNPPMLQREGPPQDYKVLMNKNQDCFVTSAVTMSPFEKGLSPQPPMSVTSSGYRGSVKPPYAAAASQFRQPPSQRDASWTVTGVLREQRLNNAASSRYNPGRLW